MAFFNVKNYHQSQWKRPVPQMGADEPYSLREPIIIPEPLEVPIYPYQELVLPLQDYAAGATPPVFTGIELPEYIEVQGTDLVITVPGNIAEQADAQGTIEVEIEAEN